MEQSQSTKEIDLYLRVSTEEQKKKKTSPEAQLNRLKGFYKNCKVNNIYNQDIGKTATIKDDKIDITIKDNKLVASFDLTQRPAIIKISQNIKDEKASPELLMWKWDRFSRNSIFQELMFMYLKRHGIELTPTDDSKVPIVRRLMGTLNQQETETIRERVNLIHRDKLNKGLTINRPPFGYKFNAKKELVLDGKKASIVRSLFNSRASGKAVKNMAKEFKLPIRKVYRILQNTTYTGKVVYGNQIYEGKHPVIISEELFKKVNNG